MKVKICQKALQKKMVLEEEGGNLVKVVVGILEKGKKQQIKYSKIAHAVTASIALLD